MKNIVYLFAFAFSILSCTNDIKKNNPAMQAKVNDVVWRATDARITPNEEGGITITALTLNETITLNTNSNEPGTYIFGSTNQDNYVTYDLSISGVLSSFETSIYPGPAYKIANIVAAGSGYVSSNNAQTTGGSGSGLKVSIVANTTGGTVTNVDIVARGNGYKAGDLVTIVGGNNNATIRILNVQQSNGEVIIEKVEGGKYTGTFKFNAVDEDSGAVVTFSNGVFYKL
jgi:hypothetical protein